MKTLLLLTLAIGMMGCCDQPITVEHKVIEKTILGDKFGQPNYYLLFDNGHNKGVTSQQYVTSKVGDVWVFNECK